MTAPKIPEVAIDAPCPTCGHPKYRHAETSHWPEGPCSYCRRETDPFRSGSPRTVEDCCPLTSAQVGDAIRAAIEEATA